MYTPPIEDWNRTKSYTSGYIFCNPSWSRRGLWTAKESNFGNELKLQRNILPKNSGETRTQLSQKYFPSPPKVTQSRFKTKDCPIQLATKSLIEGFHQAPITIGTANIQPYKKSNQPFLAKHCPLGWILFFIKLKHAFTTISKSGLYLCSRNTVIWFVMSTVFIWFVNSIYQI